jgi:hypothetical protein
MRLRPQFQLRFRDAGQYVEIQHLARLAGKSMNEWILCRLERVVGAQGDDNPFDEIPDADS